MDSTTDDIVVNGLPGVGKSYAMLSIVDNWYKKKIKREIPYLYK